MRHFLLIAASLVLGMVAAMTSEAPATTPASRHVIVLGGGCFWCVEAAMHAVPGVLAAESGYAAGRVDNPTYEQICDGDTGHAEVVRVTFDPQQVGLPKLLKLFFHVHDPTTLNRQGHDTGTQYRSVILLSDESQRPAVTTAIAEQQARFSRPIVTEVALLAVTGPGRFHRAEEYHQRFFEKNPTQGYCLATIPPKLEKVKKVLAQE